MIQIIAIDGFDDTTDALSMAVIQEGDAASVVRYDRAGNMTEQHPLDIEPESFAYKVPSLLLKPYLEVKDYSDGNALGELVARHLESRPPVPEDEW